MRIFCLLFSFLVTFEAFGELLLNPDSRHAQYQSYGLFFDPQSVLLFRTGGRGWGAIGGSAALVEVTDQKWRPQYIIHASANVAYDFSQKAGGTLYTETIDARVGFACDLKFTEDWRGAIIWTHQSGHIADNVPDPDLIGPDLGNEMIDLRVVHDIGNSWRIGGGFRPFVFSHPIIPFFGAHQFIEWFPYGASNNIHKFSPYISSGIEFYSSDDFNATFHVQAGLVAGNHFSETSQQGMRFIVGYYNGEDPRLKYFQYKHRKDNFGYAGIALEL